MIRSTKSILLTTALIGSLLSFSSHAHHSFQAFDMQRSIELEGTLVDIHFRSPHVYYTLEVTGESGEPERWDVETQSPGSLRRRGVLADTFAIGDHLIMEVHPARNPEKRIADADVITTVEGTEYVVSVMRSPGGDNAEPELTPAKSIAGTWQGPGTGSPTGLLQALNGEALENWPLTQAGRAELDAFDGTQNSAVNCSPYVPPAVMLTGSTKLIEVTDSAVSIRSSGLDRTIYLNGEGSQQDPEASLAGHSLGRWEGDTLVVETTNFSLNQTGIALGVPSSMGKRLTERFALNDDKTRLQYSFTVEDPTYLTEPVSRSAEWLHRPEREYVVAECDPETAKRFLDAY